MTAYKNSGKRDIRGRQTGIALAMLALGILSGCAATPAERQATYAAADAGGDEALLSIADRMASRGQNAAAAALYRQAFSEGEGAPALIGLGRSLMAIGRYAEAEEALLIARGRNSRLPEVYLALGEVNLAYSRADLALENFDQALALQSSARGLSARAIALDALGRHGEALEAHDRAVAMGGEDANLLSNMALSHALHDDSARAIALLERIVATPAAEAQHRQNLVLAYVFAGETQKALDMASVDLDRASAFETVAYFQELASLTADERVKALLFGAQAPERDLSDVAVLVLPNDEGRKAAAKKLVTEPEPEPEPEPMPEPEPVGLPPLLDAEGWSVQIAAYRKADQIIAGQKYYWETFADILGPFAPRRSEVDFGDRDAPPRGFFYRLNAGSLKDYDEAAGICAKLKAVGAPCWIRPPEPKEGRLPASD